MAERETPHHEVLSKEERIRQYLESELGGDVDRADPHRRMSVEGCIFGASWLIGKSVERQALILVDTKRLLERQEEVSQEILSESRAVRKLTIAVVVLTAVVVVLAAATVGVTIAPLIKG